MGLERIGLVGLVAGVVLGGLVATTGCVGSDDTVSGGEEAELQSGRFHHRHRVPDAGGATGGATAGTNGGTAGTNGGTAGTNGATAADCDVCTKAQQCCFAVGVQSC